MSMSGIQPTRIETPDKPHVIGYAGPTTNMPPTFAVVWCRILALWMLGWGLYAESAFVGMLLISMSGFRARQMFAQEWGVMFMEGLPGIVWLLMAWYCWRKAPALASRMTRDLGDGQNLSARGMTADELLHVLLMGIGIYLLSIGLSAIAQWAGTKFEAMHSGPVVGQVSNTIVSPSIYGSIVRCILGFWFIFGTHGLVILLRRHGGKWRDESKTGTSD
jgi:hypothetical protein